MAQATFAWLTRRVRDDVPVTPVPERRQIVAWQDAEENAAAWMRHWGFEDAATTPPGTDAGLDVISRAALAQVKFEASQIGRPALQRLVGARGPYQEKALLFFTGTDFSSQARRYADEMHIALFRYALDGHMEALNPSAVRIASRRNEELLQGTGAGGEVDLAPRTASALLSHVEHMETLLADLTHTDRVGVIDALLLGKSDVALRRYRTATGARLLDAENLIRTLAKHLR
jgi:hypothetical protein